MNYPSRARIVSEAEAEVLRSRASPLYYPAPRMAEMLRTSLTYIHPGFS